MEWDNEISRAIPNSFQPPGQHGIQKRFGAPKQILQRNQGNLIRNPGFNNPGLGKKDRWKGKGVSYPSKHASGIQTLDPFAHVEIAWLGNNPIFRYSGWFRPSINAPGEVWLHVETLPIRFLAIDPLVNLLLLMEP